MRPLAGLAYSALLAGACLGAGRVPHVVEAYPSGRQVPENLLRVSLVFDASPLPGVLSRLALTGDVRASIQRIFLDQELWSADGRTLTVLLDPGRVKTGTEANQAWGRAIHQRGDVRLTLDGETLKQWHVSAPCAMSPDPASWSIAAPRADSTVPLVVSLRSPIDHLDKDLIAVAAPDGHRLQGTTRLLSGETVWQFTPDSKWRRGDYRLVVNPDLEDAAGNSVAQPFELQRQDLRSSVVSPPSRPFEVH